MNAADFLDAYKRRVMPGFEGPVTAAVVGVPQEDGTRAPVKMNIPGLKDDEYVGAGGIFGNEITDPELRATYEEYGMPPFMGAMGPARSQTGKQIPIPAHPSFNREATLKYMPEVMEGIGPGMMPGFR